MANFINQILRGNASDVLKYIPDESIDCVMTSPPYWALRDYQIKDEIVWDEREDDGIIGCWNGGKHEWKTKDGFCSKCGAWKGQLGLEPTFELYIKHLCDIFDEIKRVLKKSGTCWVNIGDTYTSTAQGTYNSPDKISGDRDAGINTRANYRPFTGLPSKSLCNIPARFSIEMQNRGWILRNNLIWWKPNCMPSSVKDRFTIDFEYIFFFVKNKKYFFETQYEPNTSKNNQPEFIDKTFEGKENNMRINHGGNRNPDFLNPLGRNKRAVWRITTHPFPESHFAVFPEELCETPLKAGCPEFVCNKCGKAREKIIESKNKERTRKSGEGQDTEIGTKGRAGCLEIKEKGYTDCNCNTGFSGGIVIDPFFGAGTTGLVALKQNKRFIGIELNPEYIKIAQERLKPFLEQSKLMDLEQPKKEGKNE